MEEEDTGNKIINPDHATDVGIFEHPNLVVNLSNAAQGQGGGRGKKPQVEGHKIEDHLKRTSQTKICKNTITARNGKSDVGISSFHNLVVNCSNGARGQGSREFEGICHNIHDNKITAENRSAKVWLENFGNVNYNCKTTSTKDHGKAAAGSSSAQGEGGDLNIHDYNITGDKVQKANHNFRNFECNLKTTNTEDGGSTNQSIIYNNQITARNGSSKVGMFNFHNVYINAGQGQGGCEGNEGFVKHKGISHNIYKNTIIAVNSRNVGLQNFGNIKVDVAIGLQSKFFKILQSLGLSY